MTIDRRSFVGGAGALVGCSIGGIALGQGRPPVTAEEDALYADVEPYRSHRVLTVPGSDQ